MPWSWLRSMSLQLNPEHSVAWFAYVVIMYWIEDDAISKLFKFVQISGVELGWLRCFESNFVGFQGCRGIISGPLDLLDPPISRKEAFDEASAILRLGENQERQKKNWLEIRWTFRVLFHFLFGSFKYTSNSEFGDSRCWKAARKRSKSNRKCVDLENLSNDSRY